MMRVVASSDPLPPDHPLHCFVSVLFKSIRTGCVDIVLG